VKPETTRKSLSTKEKVSLFLILALVLSSIARLIRSNSLSNTLGDNVNKGHKTNSSRRELELPSEGEKPHIIFEDKKYRRICAQVHSSILCLILRHPFDVPLQNQNVSFPSPVSPLFYELKGVTILEGSRLDRCRQQNRTSAVVGGGSNRKSLFWDSVHHCLEEEVESIQTEQDRNSTVLGVFTRENMYTGIDYFGTGSQAQKNRAHRFFANQTVVLLGASPTPGVTDCLTSLFEVCKKTNPGQYECRETAKNGAAVSDGLTVDLHYTHYFPKPKGRGHDFHLNGNVISQLETRNVTNGDDGSASRRLRDLTVLVEFPFAHTQTESMLRNRHELVVYNHVAYVEHVLNLTNAAGELADKGWKLHRMIAFDGLPQHFPTRTNTFVQANSKKTVEQGSYPNWRREHGIGCTGPVPPNSEQTQASRISRRTFENHEDVFDFQFYGKVWEFSNQFWWQTKGQIFGNRGSRLDCTHHQTSRAGSKNDCGSYFTYPAGSKNDCGAWCMHKYFVQAMVDDHYEALEHKTM
jgi:hypothetical protein